MDNSLEEEEKQVIKCLPPNFAEELLELEMQIEESDIIPIDTVTKLIKIYAIGIEYYESISSKRYLIFKNKTQSLLLRQNVNMAMKEDQQKKEEEKIKQYQEQLAQENDNSQSMRRHSVKSEQFIASTSDLGTNTQPDLLLPETKILNNEMAQKQKEIELNMTFINQQDNKFNIQKMLNAANHVQVKNQEIVEDDKKKQEDLIQKRIKRRKQKKTQKKNNHNQQSQSAQYINTEEDASNIDSEQVITTQTTEKTDEDLEQQNNNNEMFFENQFQATINSIDDSDNEGEEEEIIFDHDHGVKSRSSSIGYNGILKDQSLNIKTSGQLLLVDQQKINNENDSNASNLLKENI